MFSISKDLQRIRAPNAIQFIQQQAKRGDFVKLDISRPTYLLSNAADIRYILMKVPLLFNKSWFATDFKSFFGRGLFSSEGAEHRCQRKLLQPMMSKQTVALLVDKMIKDVEKRSSSWKSEQELNLVQELTHMGALTMAKFIFDIDDESEAYRLYELSITCHRRFCEKNYSGFQLPSFVPSRKNLRYKRANKSMNLEVLRLLKRARSKQNNYGNTDGTLINHLLKNEETLTDTQIVDQLKTFTIVSADPIRTLGWTIYEVSKNKNLKNNVDTELETLKPFEPYNSTVFSRLSYMNMLYSETIRKYPHTWILHRRVSEPIKLPSGNSLTEGADVFISPLVMHRNEQYFPNPDMFEPTRFENKQNESWPKGAYLPFGLGPRSCIGEQYARLQANVTLSYLFKNFSFVFDEQPQYDTPNFFTMQPISHVMKAKVSRI